MTILEDSDIVVRNLDEVLEEKDHYINKHPRAPRFPFRMCVSGPSACGKTNFVLEMALNYLYYDKIYFYSTSLEQGKYKKLKEFYKMIDDEVKEEWKKTMEKKKNNIKINKLSQSLQHRTPEPEPIAEFVNIDEGLPNIDDVDSSKQNILVFDDCILNKDQSAFINFFVRGRHKGCACIYLTQKFHAVPILIRDQLTDLIFYTRPSTSALNAIASSVPSGADYRDLKEIFNRAMLKPFDYLYINQRVPDQNKRFKRNMNEYIPLDEVREYIENKPRKNKAPNKKKIIEKEEKEEEEEDAEDADDVIVQKKIE